MVFENTPGVLRLDGHKRLEGKHVDAPNEAAGDSSLVGQRPHNVARDDAVAFAKRNEELKFRVGPTGRTLLTRGPVGAFTAAASVVWGLVGRTLGEVDAFPRSKFGKQRHADRASLTPVDERVPPFPRKFERGGFNFEIFLKCRGEPALLHRHNLCI